MNLLPLLLAIAAEPPPLSVLADLPGESTCTRQAELYRRHRAWLVSRRWLHGYQSGIWSAYLADCDLALAYWSRLAEAQQFAGWSPGWENVARGFLAGVLELVGPARFGQRWHPALIPAGLYPDPPEPPGASGNNAAGGVP